MLIIALLCFGILVGGLAQLILGRRMDDINWGEAVVSGLIGSFVGGLLLSLLTGNGLDIHATGLIGSVVGALVVTLAWGALRKKA